MGCFNSEVVYALHALGLPPRPRLRPEPALPLAPLLELDPVRLRRPDQNPLPRPLLRRPDLPLGDRARRPDRRPDRRGRPPAPPRRPLPPHHRLRRHRRPPRDRPQVQGLRPVLADLHPRVPRRGPRPLPPRRVRAARPLPRRPRLTPNAPSTGTTRNTPSRWSPSARPAARDGPAPAPISINRSIPASLAVLPEQGEQQVVVRVGVAEVLPERLGVLDADLRAPPPRPARPGCRGTRRSRAAGAASSAGWRGRRASRA